MGWLTGWGYRKLHEVNGVAAGPLTDYQVRVTVHKGVGVDGGEDVYLGANVRDDFGDVRPTAGDGQSLDPYWMESLNPGVQAVFWFKVPVIPQAPGVATVYVYYGKADASTTSDIKAASKWGHGDDFNDNTRDPNIWDELRVGAGAPTEQNQRLELSVPSAGSEAGFVSHAVHDFHNLELRVLGHNTVIQELVIYLHTTKVTNQNPWTPDHWYRFMMYCHGTLYVQRKVSGVSSTLYSGALMSTEELLRIRLENNTIRFYEQDTQRATENWALPSRAIYIILAGSETAGYRGMDWFDTFWIREFVTPEPTHGAWGSEETPPTPPPPPPPPPPLKGVEIEKYRRRTLFVKLQKRLREQRKAQGEITLVNRAVAQAQVALNQDKVRDVLDASLEYSDLRHQYSAYALALDKTQREMVFMVDLVREHQILRDRFERRGLNPVVLDRLDRVFIHKKEDP